MSEWRDVKLGDVASEVTVGFVGPMANEYIGNGIPFLRSQNVKPYKIDFSGIKYISEEFNKKLLKSELHPGDVVIVRTGVPGTCALIPSAYERLNCADLVIVKCGIELNNNYFVYYMNSIAGAHVYAHIVGAVQQHFNVGSAKSMQMKLPPLPEQKAIAGVLSSLDNKIDLLHRQNKTLEAMAEVLFRQWFVEEADESWEKKTLGEISDIKAGGDKPKVFSKIKTDSCNIPIYSNGINNEGLYGYTDSAKIHIESITISARGTIGYVCLRQEPYFPIVRLISIVPNEKIVSSKYLYLWAKSQIISGTGTTQQQLTVPDFSSSNLTLPPFEIMKEFTMCVDELFNKIQFNKSQIHTLDKLRDTLLPKLMSAEVRVSV